MEQIEIKEKELKALMAEGLLLEAIAERLGAKPNVIRAAAKVFGLNLRKKPTTRTPKYVFVKDEDSIETSQEVLANVSNIQPKTKKVKEVKTEETISEESLVNSSNFVNTLLSKEEEPALDKAKAEDDFGL